MINVNNIKMATANHFQNDHRESFQNDPFKRDHKEII